MEEDNKKYTWGEIQIETCKKMFLNSKIISTSDLATLRVDNNYRTYFNGMAQAANEGIAEIIKRGKPYIKTFSFVKNTSDNLLGDKLETFSHTTSDITFEADTGLEYYFEVDNKATVEIYVNDVLFKTITSDAKKPSSYTVYKGYITNTSSQKVKIIFKGNYPYHFRNVCVYGLNYDYDGEKDIDNIPNYTNEAEIDLKTLIPDFYKVFKFYYQDTVMTNNTDYHMSDHYTLRITDFKDGNYIVKYQAYVDKINDETEDDYELPLEYEMAVLLPLYMASELYKDDDISLATIYRNEFEAAVESSYSTQNDLKFISKTGWL